MKEYQPPLLRWIPLRIEDNFCFSVPPGGNEDIGYDDWN